MSVEVKEFAKIINKESASKTVHSITLDNGILSATLLSMGANLYCMFVPDKNGHKTDISLGLATAQEYVDYTSCFGMTIGPVTNRISGGAFVLGDTTYRLPQNEKGNTLHSGGGKGCFQYKIFDFEVGENNNVPYCKFFLWCKDLEDCFPGNRYFEITYKLIDSSLDIEYYATTDKPTYINLTNHSYFNLTGNASQHVLDYELSINSDLVTEMNPDTLIPTGKMVKVDESLDFTKPRRIGEIIPKYPIFGFDHYFAVDGFPKFRELARLYSSESGIVMETWSDTPGVQLYTANSQAKSGIVDKYGNKCCDFCAVCLETAYFTDNPNKNWKNNCLVLPEIPFRSHTSYKFV